MPESTKTTQSVFGGNPYEISLGTGAENKTAGRERARRDGRQLLLGLTQNLRIAAILRRLEELEERRVTIEVRVRDTPLQPLSDSSPSTRHWGLNRVSNDTIETLRRKDYYDNENCLFDLLVERLPFDQWGSVTAGFSYHDLHYPLDFELYPNRSQYRIRSESEDREVARKRCHQVLRESILQIKNWEELLEQGPEDINAPWFDDRWCITLWRTIKLSN